MIAFLFLAAFSLPAVAARNNNPIDTAVPVEMKFAGLINDKPVFQLDFSGTTELNDFTIIVLDKDGNTLYRETVRGEQFTKKFLLNTDEIGDDTLRFEIYCTDNKRSVSFEVNRQTRFVQDIAIRKFK